MNLLRKSIMYFPLFFLLVGCAGDLDNKKQTFEDHGALYELQLPAGWKENKDQTLEHGLHTAFSAEDNRSNSYLFISSTPVNEVNQKGFGDQTRKKIKERYKYKKVKDVYMKEYKIGAYPVYKYTVLTTFKEKSVWAHFYYVWTEHGFVQLSFYSADDNSYKNRSKKIDAAVETFKEVDFDKRKAEQAKEKLKKEEGDIVTIENEELKMEITAVRKLTGKEGKSLLAIRYIFTNLAGKLIEPAIWETLVTAKQKEHALSKGELAENNDFLDVKNLIATQTVPVKQGESLETAVLYELVDESTVELVYAQTAFPNKLPTRVVVPK